MRRSNSTSTFRLPSALAPWGVLPFRLPRLARCACPLFALGLAVTTSLPAQAAQTDIAISTAAPPAAPRILGPTILGATPSAAFLHTVSATGQSPLRFAASGLPAGLSIDADTGTISGTTPASGSYSIDVTVTNSAGSAEARWTLTSGSTLALTPPMGWNSYDSFGSSVKEEEVLSAAQAMKTQLQPFGWDTVVIDYLWYDPEQAIDANGRFLPSKSKYPSAGSAGFKPLADKIHALGLRFGIHLMRGIARKAVTADSPIAGSTYTASQAGSTGDTCSWDSHMYGVKADTAAGKAWYDSIYAQYAEWGVDFVKVDDMMNPYGGNVLHSAEVEAVHTSIGKTGRSMILSLSPGPNQVKDVAVLNANANLWRTVNDFWDTSGLSSLSDEFSAANSWANTSGVTQGHWPDADMLPLGYIGPRCPVHDSGPSKLSRNQQVTVMTLWGILPSPLMFGGNPTKLSGDDWTTALLTNEEVLAVNQDATGARAKRVSQQGSTEIWARDLSDGRKAVALFNRGTQDATMSVTFSQLGVSGDPAVRDLWHRSDVTEATSGISVNVPHEGALLYTLTPSGGDGGASGAGGASGDSGTGATAGRGGTAGTTSRTGATGGGGIAANTGGLARDASASPATGHGGDAEDDTAATPGDSGRESKGGRSGPATQGTGGSAYPGSGDATTKGSGGVARTSAGAGASGMQDVMGGDFGQSPSSASGCSCGLASQNTRAPWLFLALGATSAIRSRRRRTSHLSRPTRRVRSVPT